MKCGLSLIRLAHSLVGHGQNRTDKWPREGARLQRECLAQPFDGLVILSRSVMHLSEKLTHQPVASNRATTCQFSEPWQISVFIRRQHPRTDQFETRITPAFRHSQRLAHPSADVAIA